MGKAAAWRWLQMVPQRQHHHLCSSSHQYPSNGMSRHPPTVLKSSAHSGAGLSPCNNDRPSPWCIGHRKPMMHTLSTDWWRASGAHFHSPRRIALRPSNHCSRSAATSHAVQRPPIIALLSLPISNGRRHAVSQAIRAQFCHLLLRTSAGRASLCSYLLRSLIKLCEQVSTHLSFSIDFFPPSSIRGFLQQN